MNTIPIGLPIELNSGKGEPIIAYATTTYEVSCWFDFPCCGGSEFLKDVSSVKKPRITFRPRCPKCGILYRKDINRKDYQ